MTNKTLGPHDINWGSHGCMLATYHVPFKECECDCCECDGPCKPSCVAKYPHYGEGETNYY